MKKVFGSQGFSGPEKCCLVNPLSGYEVHVKDLKEIHKVAIEGDTAEMQDILLRQIAVLNCRDKNNRTALHFACVNGHHEVVTQLVNARCLLNLCDSENRTPLIKAVQCQQELCATILLEYGADLNVMDICGNTALHYAVISSDTLLTANLLSYTVDMEAKNKDGYTPLLYAVHNNNKVMVEYLLIKGADIQAVDKNKRNALMISLYCESPDIIKLLLQQGIDIFHKDVLGKTAVDYASYLGFEINFQVISEHLSASKEMLSQNNNQGVEGKPRDIYSCSGHQLISEGPVKQKAKKYQPSNKVLDLNSEIWEKPRIGGLWKSVGKEIKKVFGMDIEKTPEVSYFVDPKSGYQVFAKDLKEIHKAAIAGDPIKMEKVLSQQITTLNDRDKGNRTALHFACINGEHEVVTQLLDAKCKLNLCDNENCTALIKAVQCRQSECALMLMEHGADPKVTDIYGNTALHYAACCKHLLVVTKLLSCDVDIEARNKNGFTPLLLAVSKNNQQMVEFLISKGANVHTVDVLKRTALMLSLHCISSDMVIYLLQHGVDVLCRDIFGRSAKDYAIKYGLNMNCQKITEYLAESEKRKPHVSNQGMNNNAIEISSCSNHQTTSEDKVERIKPNFCPNMIYGLYYGAYDTDENSFASGNQQLLSEDVSEEKTPEYSSSENNIQDLGSTSVILNNENFSRRRKIIVGDKSHSTAQNLSAGRRMVHSYISDDPENFHNSLPDVEEIEISPYRASWRYLQACKPAFPDKYPDFKQPTTEANDSVVNDEDAKTSVSDSLDKDPNLKFPMEAEDSVPNKAVEVKETQAPASDVSAAVAFKMSEEMKESLDGNENHCLSACKEDVSRKEQG